MKVAIDTIGPRVTRARNASELLSVISDLGKLVDDDEKVVGNLLKSISSSRTRMRISLSADQEIKIDHTGGAGRKARAPIVQRLDKFVRPKVQELTSHSSVLDSLYEKLATCKHIESTLSQEFSNSKESAKAKAEISKLRQHVELLIEKALNALAELASRHVPKEIEAMADALVELIDKALPAPKTRAVGIDEYLYVRSIDGKIIFSHYAQLHDLVDNHGYKYDEFWLVMTGVVDENGMLSFRLTMMNSMVPPGRYPLGKRVANTNEMKTALAMLISTNDLTSELGRKVLPFSKAQAGKLKRVEGVIDSDIKSNELWVRINAKADATKVHNNCIVVLSNLVGRTANKFKVREVKEEGKRYLVYVLVGSSKTGGMDAGKLDLAADLLGLDEDEVDALREQLSRREK